MATTYAISSDFELHVSIGIVNKICQDALETLEKDFTNSDEIQVASLEAVAKARIGLDMASKFMYMSVVSGDESWSTHETRGALDFLFTTVKALCTTRGPYRSPALFLLKQLVKRYGVHSIATISQNEDMSWIVPAEFHRGLVRIFYFPIFSFKLQPSQVKFNYAFFFLSSNEEKQAKSWNQP